MCCTLRSVVTAVFPAVVYGYTTNSKVLRVLSTPWEQRLLTKKLIPIFD